MQRKRKMLQREGVVFEGFKVAAECLHVFGRGREHGDVVVGCGSVDDLRPPAKKARRAKKGKS